MPRSAMAAQAFGQLHCLPATTTFFLENAEHVSTRLPK